MNTTNETRGISEESSQIAAAVDRFPQHVREQLRVAVMNIVGVYRAAGWESIVRVPESRGTPANVISLADRRRGLTA